MQDRDILDGIEEYYTNSSEDSHEDYSQDIFYSDYTEWKNPSKLHNKVWIDMEVGTVVIIESPVVEGDSLDDELEGCGYGSDSLTFRLRPGKGISAGVSLGQVFYPRQPGQKMEQYHHQVIRDVADQILGYDGHLDRDGIATMTGDGTLRHMMTAGKMVKAIAKHLGKGGRPVRLYICGLDDRRSRAYRWVAKKLGFVADRDEFYYSINQR